MSSTLFRLRGPLSLFTLSSGKNESKGPMQSFNKIKAPHNELIPLLQNRSRLIRRFSSFFGMEPRNRLQVFSPFLVKAALIASIGGILFGCK